MSRFVVGNLLLLGSMICAASSQILIKGVLDDVRPERFDWVTIQEFLRPDRLLRGGGGFLVMVAGFVFWILCLIRLDLSYAYPIACSSVLFVALFSAIVLGEPVTLRIWAGTALVLAGVILLGPSR